MEILNKEHFIYSFDKKLSLCFIDIKKEMPRDGISINNYIIA